jgi:hypothetical protein
MKAKIEIKFRTINGLKVDESMLKKIPQLISSTEKAIKILCQQIEKYFKDKKINVKINYEILEK